MMGGLVIRKSRGFLDGLKTTGTVHPRIITYPVPNLYSFSGRPNVLDTETLSVQLPYLILGDIDHNAPSRMASQLMPPWARIGGIARDIVDA
jgi:hypothetical protein